MFKANPIEIDETKLVMWHEADSSLTPGPDNSHPGIKLTFQHLSDVQLRDEQVRMYDKATTRLADYVIPSFEHGPLQEVFDGALYFAIIQTINATVTNYPDGDPRKPRFMIHTGDAIDAGVVNELYEFLYITNEVQMPWYNAIGNHDVGTFGNIKQKLIYVNDPFVEFMTMHSKFNFINLHHNAYEYYPFVNVSPKNTGMDYTTREADVLYSKYNGFDKRNYTPEQISSEEFICANCPGYYSLEVKAKDDGTRDPAIQMIVLDTGFGFGAYGVIDDEQLNWLIQELENSTSKLVMVFGHHNIQSIKNGKEIKDLFIKHSNVIAYFCGHTHKHKIKYHPGDENNYGFWEVITGAIFHYPQQGSIARIRYEEGIGLLEIYAFEHTIQEKYLDIHGVEQHSKLYSHVKMGYEGALADISTQEKTNIDENPKHRYATLKFPYPKLQ
jgi:3',5'-cyclic AMP phosphodiesterase CpdA